MTRRVLTRRVLFVLLPFALLLAGAGLAHAQDASEDASEYASESASEQASEEASEQASEDASEQASEDASEEATEGTTEEATSSEEATEEAGDTGTQEDSGEGLDDGSEPAPEPSGGDNGGDEAAGGEDQPDDGGGFILGLPGGEEPEQEPAPETAEVALESNAALDAGIAVDPAAGPVPSRVDAGGGYLAESRDQRQGMGWAVLAGLALLALLLPRARAAIRHRG